MGHFNEAFAQFLKLECSSPSSPAKESFIKEIEGTDKQIR